MGSRVLLWICTAAAGLAIAACGDDATPLGASNGGNSGAAGTAGVSGNAGADFGSDRQDSDSGAAGVSGTDSGPDGDDSDAGPDSSGPSDQERLLACYPEVRCSGSGAHIVEGMRFLDGPQAACLLVAMRDRTPGLYSYTTSHNPLYGGPVFTSRILFSILADGSAITVTDESSPASRCQLGPPAHFDQCLAPSVNPDSGASLFSESLFWECMFYRIGWFENCVTESPVSCP